MKDFNSEKFKQLVLDEGSQKCRGKVSCDTAFDANELMPAESFVPNLILYAQVSCSSDEKEVEYKNYIGMAAACLGFLQVVLFRAALSDEALTHNIKRKLIEMYSFVTIDSFTVHCDIPESLY